MGKAESGVASQEGRVTKVKTEDLEAVSDGVLSEELEDVSEDEDMEEVSDSEDGGKSSDESEDVSEIDSDEDLRLTSLARTMEGGSGRSKLASTMRRYRKRFCRRRSE